MYKVLLVDDEYMITEGLKRLIPFDKWDMEVVATANHADDALDYVREHPVDIVISDVNMPDKTGLEMIGEMKDLLPDAYYILLSGYQEFDYVKKAIIWLNQSIRSSWDIYLKKSLLNFVRRFKSQRP